jgi:lipopolysaccharide transport system ATP-binding protein
MKPIIKVENLSKQYVIGGKKDPYSTFRESLVNAARIPLNAIKRRNKENSNNRFWALKDINFEVMPGEVVGIIGRNGAGKSTLLKVLSRITEPTKGRIELYGRVGSLLEVGTGFHPELTGRENIYLNGAILGMKREEISKKFDEIVDFAEVDDFLDTPVKRYSSGMYTRLAFAVAANLEPEILVVDEVLSVGDAEFQKKCLGKMESVAKTGRTVLFVSHNMTAVQSLCGKSIQLKKGKIESIGETSEVINNYLTTEVKDQYEVNWKEIDNAPGNNSVRIKSVKLKPHFIADSDVIDVRTPLDLSIEFWNLINNQEINLIIFLFNSKNEIIFKIVSQSIKLKVGIADGHLKIPGNFLNDGTHYISVLILKDRSTSLFYLDEVVTFTVEDFREGLAWYGRWEGIIRPNFIRLNLAQNLNNRSS